MSKPAFVCSGMLFVSFPASSVLGLEKVVELVKSREVLVMLSFEIREGRVPLTIEILMNLVLVPFKALASLEGLI